MRRSFIVFSILLIISLMFPITVNALTDEQFTYVQSDLMGYYPLTDDGKNKVEGIDYFVDDWARQSGRYPSEWEWQNCSMEIWMDVYRTGKDVDGQYVYSGVGRYNMI